MGLIPWYTLTDAFDADFDVGEWHGTNAFIRDDGGDRLFRTYFINDRGDEQMGSTWNYLDITALGRQEAWEDLPEGYPQTPPYDWWIWHDDPSVADPDRPGLVQLRAARAPRKPDHGLNTVANADAARRTTTHTARAGDAFARRGSRTPASETPLVGAQSASGRSRRLQPTWESSLTRS